jgi:hypothetical protein
VQESMRTSMLACMVVPGLPWYTPCTALMPYTQVQVAPTGSRVRVLLEQPMPSFSPPFRPLWNIMQRCRPWGCLCLELQVVITAGRGRDCEVIRTWALGDGEPGGAHISCCRLISISQPAPALHLGAEDVHGAGEIAAVSKENAVLKENARTHGGATPALEPTALFMYMSPLHFCFSPSHPDFISAPATLPCLTGSKPMTNMPRARHQLLLNAY